MGTRIPLVACAAAVLAGCMPANSTWRSEAKLPADGATSYFVRDGRVAVVLVTVGAVRGEVSGSPAGFEGRFVAGDRRTVDWTFTPHPDRPGGVVRVACRTSTLRRDEPAPPAAEYDTAAGHVIAVTLAGPPRAEQFVADEMPAPPAGDAAVRSWSRWHVLAAGLPDLPDLAAFLSSNDGLLVPQDGPPVALRPQPRSSFVSAKR